MTQEFDNGEYEIEEQLTQEENASCGCGKNHERKQNQVIMGMVDGHLFGTMTCMVRPEIAITELNAKLSLMDINLFIQEQGGTPRQMKASLKDLDTVVTLNLVGSDIMRGEGKTDMEIMDGNVKVNLLVAADGISDQVLRGKLEEIMSYFVNDTF